MIQHNNENKPNKCILLARVSTSQQEYDAQIWDLKKYAETFGFAPNDCFDIKNKESGFKTFDKRDGFKQVIDKVESNEGYNTIICTEFSRLSRNETVLHLIKDYLVNNKIQLIIKDSNFKLLDDNNEVSSNTNIVFALFASLAKEDALRLKRGIRARKELNSKGYSIVGKRLFGYDRILDGLKKRNTYIINEKESKEIKEIYYYYLNNNKSIVDVVKYAIEKGFSKYLHSKRNVTKLLGEEAYTGYKVTNNLRKNAKYWNYGEMDEPKYIRCSTEIKYPQIISKDLFDEVQLKKIGNRINVDKSSKHTTILAKLIKCNCCGRFLTANYRMRDNIIAHTYRCSKRREIDNCNSKSSYSMFLLDSVIWSFIKDNVSMLVSNLQSENYDNRKKEILNAIKIYNEEIKKLKNEIEKESNIYRVTANINPNALNDFEKKVNKITNEIKNYEKEIESYFNEINNINSLRQRDLKNEITESIKEIENSKELLQKYIHELIKEISIIYNDRNYMLIEVTSKEYLGSEPTIRKNKLKGEVYFKLPKENKRYNIKYYIIVSKSNGREIKARYLIQSDAIFRNGYFYSINAQGRIMSSEISFEDLFNYNLELREKLINNIIKDDRTRKEFFRQSKELTLYSDIEEINFKRLQVYK